MIVQAYKEFTSPSEPLSCSVLSEGDGEKGPLLLGELYHGPTMTFKDLALSVTARQTKDVVFLACSMALFLFAFRLALLLSSFTLLLLLRCDCCC